MDKNFYLPTLFFATGIFLYAVFYLGAILSSMNMSRSFVEFPKILAILSIVIGGILLYSSLGKRDSK